MLSVLVLTRYGLGFHLSVAGRSLVGRRFDPADTPAAGPHKPLGSDPMFSHGSSRWF